MWVKSAGCGGAAQELADLYPSLIIWPNISSYNQPPAPPHRSRWMNGARCSRRNARVPTELGSPHHWQTTRVNSQSGRFEMHIRPIGIHWGQLQTHERVHSIEYQLKSHLNKHPYRWLEKFEKLHFQLKPPKLAEDRTLSFAYCILSFVHLNLLSIFSLLSVEWHQISG